MSQNFLKLNEDKTEVIEIGFYENRFSDLLLGNSSIKISEKAKNLGFYIDDTMSLKAQIAAVIQKCNMSLRNLHRIGSKLTKELKIQLVYSCVLSHLDYCNSVMGCISEAQLKTLQKIQNNAVRFIFGLKGKDYHKPITPYLKELHFLPVRQRIIFKIALLTYKSLHNIAPTYISDLVHRRSPNRYLLLPQKGYRQFPNHTRSST